MKVVVRWIALLALAFSTAAARSDDSQPLTTPARTGVVYTSHQQPETVVVAATADRATTAREWGLTDIEWTRYEDIMAGPRGIWSPHLDPLTALGVEARSDTERRHFAELWSRVEYQRVQRELAFETARSEAFARLYPAVRPVEYIPSVRDAAALSAPGAKRLLFFATKTCVDACREPLNRLLPLANVQSTTTLDIYVAGLDTDDQALRQWATQLAVPVGLIKAGRVTLNHEAGALAQLRLGTAALPLTLVRTADGKLSPFKS
jgi:integrating conjugative element protein (TIGR03759 family)